MFNDLVKMPQNKNIYITTPIYYINAQPHIGHTYSTVAADILARAYRLLGYDVFFLTWTDENSQKTIEWAQKLILAEKEKPESEFLQFLKDKGLGDLLDKWLSDTSEDIPLELVKAYTDWMAQVWKRTWEDMDLSFDDFIRTTEARHIKWVQKFYQKAKDRGYIYKGKYTGLYCWKCEAFYRPEDLIEEWDKFICPIHKHPVDQIEEENYFFKLSAFEDQLREIFTTHTDFVFPQFRANEMLNNFINEGLEDFSISREGKKWGIPFPDDPNHVFYVWYDALSNYITALDYAQDNPALFEKFWNNAKVIHIIGKDILKFHSIYRPAMLMAAQEKIPDQILTHGFFTVNGEKISKSLGNAIPPYELVQKYGVDSLRYYLFTDLKLGSDGDFSFQRLEDLHNSNLVWGWWNLVSRVTKLAQRAELKRAYRHQKWMDKLLDLIPDDNALKTLLVGWWDDKILLDYLNTFDFQGWIRDWYDLVQATNKLMEEVQPWVLLKQDLDQAKEFLEFGLHLIRDLALIISPILIVSTKKIKEILGDEAFEWFDFKKTKVNDTKGLFDKPEFKVVLQPMHLYPRV